MFLHKDMVFQLEQVKLKLSEHDNQILAVLKHLKALEKQKKDEINFNDRPRIGYKK